jgi:hypothetical protein
MKPYNEIKDLTNKFLENSCKDACIYGVRKCLVENRCSILTHSMNAAWNKELDEKQELLNIIQNGNKVKKNRK